MARRLAPRHREAFRATKRERGRGLAIDGRYASEIATTPGALEWLRLHDPKQAEKVEKSLRLNGVIAHGEKN